jgi:predicted dehydrogenase
MLFLPAARTYLTYEEMIKKESELPAEQRIDFITIVTPNFAHFAPAMMALDHGFHVVIEKPMTFTLDEAKQLQQKVKETGLTLCLNAYLRRLPHGKTGESNGGRRRVR